MKTILKILMLCSIIKAEVSGEEIKYGSWIVMNTQSTPEMIEKTKKIVDYVGSDLSIQEVSLKQRGNSEDKFIDKDGKVYADINEKSKEDILGILKRSNLDEITKNFGDIPLFSGVNPSKSVEIRRIDNRDVVIYRLHQAIDGNHMFYAVLISGEIFKKKIELVAYREAALINPRD